MIAMTPPVSTATKNRRKLQRTYEGVDGSFKEFEITNVCLEKLNDCSFQKELINNYFNCDQLR